MHDKAGGWAPPLADVRASSLLHDARPTALRHVRVEDERETGELRVDYYVASPLLPGLAVRHNLNAACCGLVHEHASSSVQKSIAIWATPSPLIFLSLDPRIHTLTAAGSTLYHTPYDSRFPIS